MSKEIGNRLLAKLDELKVKYDLKQPKEGMYTFDTPNFDVKLFVKLPVEIGLDITQKNVDKPSLYYSIDTDLYKLDDPENYDANNDVETEMLQALDALEKDKIVIGERRGKKAFVLPLREEFVLVYQGIFFISAKRYDDYEELLAEGKFTPTTHS